MALLFALEQDNGPGSPEFLQLVIQLKCKMHVVNSMEDTGPLLIGLVSNLQFE